FPSCPIVPAPPSSPPSPPSALFQSTSTTPGDVGTAATPLLGSAEPTLGATALIGLFHRPPLISGWRTLVNTIPSGLTQNTSTAPDDVATAATPLLGSAEPTLGATALIRLFLRPPVISGWRTL